MAPSRVVQNEKRVGVAPHMMSPRERHGSPMGLFLVTRTRTRLNPDPVTHGFFPVGVRVSTGHASVTL